MKHLQDFLEVAKMITEKVGNRGLNIRSNEKIAIHSIPNPNGHYVTVEFGKQFSQNGSLSITSSVFSGVSISCKVKEDASLFIDELWEELKLDIETFPEFLDAHLEVLIAKEVENLLTQQERIAKQLETLNK